MRRLLGLAMTYGSARCEHLGVSLARNAISTVYRCLVEDTANPGTRVPVTLGSAVAAPVYSVVPPALRATHPRSSLKYRPRNRSIPPT